jgi:hypothetical protein
MNSEVWIGTIEISYVSADDFGSSKRAFTVVTTWAASLEEFTQRCDDMLETYGWKLLGVEKANPVPDDSSFDDEVEDMLARTRANRAAIIYGTFHTYPVM